MGKKSHRSARANRYRPPRPRDALRVSLVTYPHSTGEVRGTLARDVELAKAAVLYADQVDLISLQATMLSQLSALRGTGIGGVLALVQGLDEATLRHMGLDTRQFTPEAWAMLPMLLEALENDSTRSMMPEELQNIWTELTPALSQFQDALLAIDAESGARDLGLPIDRGLLRIVELEVANLASGAVDLAAGTPADQSVADAVAAWTQQVVDLLEDPLQRVILDPMAVDVVQSLVTSGFVQAPEMSAERSRAAHLGVGFIGSLPSFPEAPFDELLDLRSELSRSLTRYRSAVVRMSRSLTASPFEKAIESEAQDIWTSEVAPALTDIEDELTDHGLVRELARTAREDARQIVTTGSGLLIGLDSLAHLSTVVSGAVAAVGVSAGVVGRSMNRQLDASSKASRAELFYLHRLNQAGRAAATP